MDETETQSAQIRRAPRLSGVWVLFGVTASFVLFLIRHHGVEPISALRVVPALYALCVIPGFVTVRYLFRLTLPTAFETLVVSFLLGLIVTPIVWYLLCFLGLEALGAPLCLALAVLVPLAERWHVQPLKKLKETIPPEHVPAILLTLSLAVIWSMQASVLERRNGQVVLVPHSEHAMHATLIAELERDIPPTTVPFLSIAESWAYHYLPDIWCDALRRFTATDVETAYYHMALPLRYVFLAIAAYLALLRRFGRNAALCGMVTMLAFVEPARFAFPNSWLGYLHYNYPTSFGITIVLTILYCTSLITHKNFRRPLLLASALSGILLWYKANQALAVGPAVAMLALVILHRQRDYRWLAPCLGVPLALVALRYMETTTAPMRPQLSFAPFAFVEWWWQTISLPGSLKAHLTGWFAAFPDAARLPGMLFTCRVQRFHCVVIIVIYLVVRKGLLRREPHRQPWDVAALGILAACTAGMVLFPIQRDLVWNIPVHVWALMSAVGFVMMGPAVWDLINWIGTKRKSVVMAAAAAALCLSVSRVQALRSEALWSTRVAHATVTDDFYECCRFIANNTPRDAVTLHPMYNENVFVSSLTNRRSVVDYAWACAQLYDMEPLLANLDRFYAGVNRNEAAALLDEYRVGYVLAEGDRPPANTDDWLRPIFRNGNVAVYKVDRKAQ